MIKEKHEKGADGSVKEEPGGSEKEGGVGVKKEEDVGGGGAASGIKKEIGVRQPSAITKNGSIIGSTNMGSLHEGVVKTEQHDDDTTTTVPQATAVKDELDAEGLSTDAFGALVSGAPPEGMQSLPSNVITKQPSSMEVQYMQQQSQIFVFSTVLANTGADEVLQGRFPSIIAFHCSQPGTKKYLEKNPLKMAQFHRQGHAQWPTAPLGGAAKSKCVRSPPVVPPVKQTTPTSGVGMPPTSGGLDFLSGDPLDDIGLGDGDLPWEAKDGENNGLGDDMDACSVQPSLQGVKVPDENLTPQQRQHREEQLATIRKLHEMLCSEGPGGVVGGPPSAGGGIGGAPAPGNPQGVPPTQGPPQQPPVSAAHGPGGPPDGLDLPGPPMDWQKMAYKPGPRTGPPGAPGPRLQGPPPPYHQTPRSASVPIALQSPNPASPNNPTSNLSLPSPSRASSALNSPADAGRPFGLQRHVSTTGQSPTSQDSPSRPNHSNPGTPISSHLSPSVNTSSADTNPSSDGLFGRTLQSMAAQQKQMAVPTSGGPNSMQPKEPNLMPVPSPQQIQYLNAFEGQELIIQKQPNTSLNKDGNMISPPVLPTTMDSGFPGSNDMAHNRLSGPNTPTSLDMGPRYPGTPSDGCRFSVPSPHTPSGSDKPNRLSGTGPGLSPQTSGPPLGDPIKNDMFPTPSPHMMDVPRFPGPSPSPGNKMAGGFVNVSPSGGGPGGPGSVGKPPMDMGPNYGCGRNDNVPLNPNCTNAMSNPKVSHFDPISSLAQMSQQLTNSVASSLNGQGGPGPGMMNFGSPSMHMMDMGGCHGMGPDMGDPMMGQMQGPPHGPPHGFHPGSPIGGPIRSLSPKLPGFGNHVGMSMPRMMGRPPGPNPYNGANVQVKPNAPNTIQYMPAKSQVGGQPPGPRAPPSLEFLQRYANPMGGPGVVPGMDGKLPPGHPGTGHPGPGHPGPGQGMPYFPGCGPNGPMGGHMDGPGGPMQDGPMGPMGMGNGGGPMMGGPPNMGMMPMMRPMRPPPPQGMMRMPMGFSGPPNGPGGPGGGPPDGMFQPGPPPNAQMFVGGPKGSPMGGGGMGMGVGGGGPPDAGQPLPPSMSQNNSFKSSPFVGGPTTADPNYAQQFHNFQQQLYATGTRNPMGGGQPMGPGPGPPMHPQQAYFNPK